MEEIGLNQTFPKMDLYYSPGSASCRSVLMVAAAVGVELNKKLINTGEKEQFKPDFLKINPQHTIPTLVDNGFTLWESRAILIYLVEKYGKDESLFPKDPQQQAIVHQRLYFDLGVLSQAYAEYYYPQFRFNKPPNPNSYEKVLTAFTLLNTFLEGNDYVAGDKFTIADIAILASVSTVEAVGFPIDKYRNVAKWYERVRKTAPGWEENEKGLELIRKRVEAMRSK